MTAPSEIRQTDCRFEPGSIIPVIDPTRCEAKGPCVPICPYGVLAIHRVPEQEKATLPFKARIKLFVHGGKQAYVQYPDACRGCGLCVQVCPEDAIKLRRTASPIGNQ